jgi:hypothetical protein
MQQLLIHSYKITTHTYKIKMNLLLINNSPKRPEKEKEIVENTHI